MASIGELVISLRADIASFRSGMDQANQQLDTLKQHSSAASDTLKELTRAFEGVASIEAVRRIADFGATLVESAAKLGHMTEALGINAEAYQTLQYAAAESGVSNDIFARSMETLTKNLELVTQGGAAQAAKVMADLGLSAKNADGSLRSAADVLRDLAGDKIFQAEDSGTKLAQVMILMGARTGEAALIVNSLNSKLADFKQAQLDAVAAGQVLSDETIKGAEKMESSLTTIWTRLKNTFVTGVVTAYQHPMASLLGAWSPDQARAIGLGGPAPTQQQYQSPPPGPAVVDPTKAKELENFSDEYKKLLAQYQEDADFQTKLRAAYQENAGAVAQVSAAHAADAAELRLLETAQRDHVTATQAEVSAVRNAAAAAELATKLAQEQKQASDAMAEAQKKYDSEVLKVMDETDGLSEKQQKLADTLGILEQQLLSGAIDWDEYAARARAAQQLIDGLGADKGMQDFARGLSSDLDSMIGKMTDFSAIAAKAQGKKGESIFAQFSKDADDFVASLEKMLLKLLIINPLLNSLGLGGSGEGRGGQLPTLWGGAGASIGAGVLPGAWGSILGFKNGGEFMVGGFGGTDSQLVAFKASPGERVSVGRDPDRGADTRRGSGDINISMPISGVHADSFKANRHQITGDMIRAISAGARRYA